MACPVLRRERVGHTGLASGGCWAHVSSGRGIASLTILEQAVEAARTFQPLTRAQVAALRSRTVEAAATGHYECFKTSDRFDATAHHPAWLG